jgi:hypothetical protein
MRDLITGRTCDSSLTHRGLQRWRDFFDVVIVSFISLIAAYTSLTTGTLIKIRIIQISCASTFIDEVLNLVCTCDVRWAFANTSRLFSFNELVGKFNNVLQWITIKHIPVCTLFQ